MNRFSFPATGRKPLTPSDFLSSYSSAGPVLLSGAGYMSRFGAALSAPDRGRDRRSERFDPARIIR